MRCIVIMLAFFCVCPGVSYSKDMNKFDVTKIDGNDWVQWPEHTRLLLLYGVVCGMNMTVYSVQGDMSASGINGDEGGDKSGAIDFSRYFVGGVSIEQLYSAINEMYSHKSTRKIILSDAVYFVKKWILGCDEDEFNAVQQYLLRRGEPDAATSLEVKRSGEAVVNKYVFP